MEFVHILGTSMIGLSSLLIIYFINKLKKLNFEKIILSNIFLLNFAASFSRIIYLIFGFIEFNYLWIIVPVLNNIGILSIALSLIIKKKYQKHLSIGILIISISYILLSIFLKFDDSLITIHCPIIGFVSFILYSYLYIKYKSKNLFIYIVAISLFALGGIFSLIYYPLCYVFMPLAILLIYYSFITNY